MTVCFWRPLQEENLILGTLFWEQLCLKWLSLCWLKTVHPRCVFSNQKYNICPVKTQQLYLSVMQSASCFGQYGHHQVVTSTEEISTYDCECYCFVPVTAWWCRYWSKRDADCMVDKWNCCIYIILYYIILYYIILYYIILYYIIYHPIISYHISYHIISYHIILYYIIMLLE